MELQAAGAGLDLLPERLRQAAVALAHQPDVDRQSLERLEHPPDVPRPGGAGRAHVPVADPVPPPISVVMPEAMAVSICCGQMKWIWVSTPPAVTISLGRDDLGARADHQPRIDAALGERVAGLADRDDPALADPMSPYPALVPRCRDRGPGDPPARCRSRGLDNYERWWEEPPAYISFAVPTLLILESEDELAVPGSSGVGTPPTQGGRPPSTRPSFVSAAEGPEMGATSSGLGAHPIAIFRRDSEGGDERAFIRTIGAG